MAYRITAECIRCGACDTDCPNQAIGEGDDIFTVDPEACTECFGSYDAAKCVEVCPVNAVVADRDHPDSYETLLARFRKRHPGQIPAAGLLLEQDKNKPVIALVADGSSDASGQAALGGLDDLIRETFPGYDVVWAVQALYMIRALKGRGQTTYFPRQVPLLLADELLVKLAAAGRKRVALQLFMTGESNFSKNAIQADTLGMDVKYGLPFLSASAPENRQKCAASLASVFGDGTETATVLVGHGSDRNFEYNEWFVGIDKYLRESHKNVFLGTLHGPPGSDGIVADVLASGCKKVRFVSLMMSRGGHMPLDVVNPENPDAWASRIGLPAETVDNFSENAALREHFLTGILALLEQFA